MAIAILIYRKVYMDLCRYRKRVAGTSFELDLGLIS